ncbi:putative fidgetin-like protein 2 [Arapaima gigas]
MLSLIVPYSVLKMHWTPEHVQPLSQWPEQHLDVSSTTSSPAHKSDLYPNGRRSYSYAWANDDISALTASNLLKRYAEKYSSVLDSPYERPTVGTYPEPAAFGGLSGQKGELEPWSLSHSSEGYPAPESLTAAKVTVSSAGLNGAANGSVANSNISEPGYSGSSCGGPPAYNGTYLSSGYCPQPGSALPSTPLHALQPAPTLVSSYTPPGPMYNYSSHQPAMGPSYPHPSGSYLPSGLAAPTPLPPRPTVMGSSYGYQSHNLVNTEAGGSLKRKAFEMTVEEDDVDSSRYRKYGYDPAKSGGTSPYSVGEKSECRGNSFSAGSTDPQAYKPSKLPSQAALRVDDVGNFSGLKPLVSPAYSGTEEYSPPARMNGENGGGEHGLSQHNLPLKVPTPCISSVDPLKGADQRLLELVNEELQDRSPALPWGELIGHTHKAALEEDLLWPVLRSVGTGRPPRVILLFGPRGGGKSTLAHSLASQLGATFFHLNGATLASKWKGEAEKVLHTLFLVAGARQPSVVLLSEVELLAEEGLRQQLLSYLETMQLSGTGLVIVVCATHRPDLLDEAVHRLFSKRYYVPLPDTGTRRQVILQSLASQGCCLSERELGSLLQRTEGFSICELLQLCQQALSSATPPGSLHSLPTPLSTPTFKDFEDAFCKVRPNGSSKELDTCMEWSKMSSH